MQKGMQMITAVILILFVPLLICGCISSNNLNLLPVDKYVAIEENYFEYGLPLQANVNIFNTLPTPPEPFDYSGAMGPYWVKQREIVDVNDSMKILVGYRSEHADPGNYSHLLTVSGIYEYPFTLASGYTIIGIDGNGTISGSYNKTSITLKTGDVWTSPVLSRVVKQDLLVWTDSDKKNTTMKTFDMQYNISWTVSNKGIFNKTNLQGH